MNPSSLSPDTFQGPSVQVSTASITRSQQIADAVKAEREYVETIKSSAEDLRFSFITSVFQPFLSHWFKESHGRVSHTIPFSWAAQEGYTRFNEDPVLG
jgi:hypothetical protein